MGGDAPDALPEDHEGPIRPVTAGPLRIGATVVTNRDFARFVAESGHVTDAERAGWSFVFHLLLHPAARPAVRDAKVPDAPWWLAVDGATWVCPEGPGSTIAGRLDHPVVHVSYRDALAYCSWSGTRLPTETEWEYAARGGLEQARYPWGDELEPGGEHRCNIWQGRFPVVNTGADGWIGTAPAEWYRPNGFGLFNTAGNVWEICDSRWIEDADTDEIVIRGGSYLCHASYCNRYRVAARSRTTADSSTGNMGFRVAA